MAKTSIITGQYVRIEQTAASVLQRTLAWAIDSGILFILCIIFISIMSNLDPILNYDTETFSASLFVLSLMLYPFLMEVFNNGQSIGKLIVGIRVVCLDGTKPSISAFFIRWITLPIDSTMGLAFIIFSKNSQRIGDLAANTTVVKRQKSYQPTVLIALNYVKKGYQPTYPEANTLTMRQMGTIEKILYMEEGERRNHYIMQLSTKISEILGVMPANNNYESFLITIYNDFQYYATKVV